MEYTLDAILEVGRGMVENGTDVRKVEDSLRRMISSYGISLKEVFVLNTVAIVTIKDLDGQIKTQVKRINTTRTDLGRYEDFNSLSRYIVSYQPDHRYIQDKIKDIRKVDKDNFIYYKIGYSLSPACFTIFFGGNIKDAFVSGIIGYVIYLLNIYIRKENSNKVIFTLFSSMISATIALIFSLILIGINIDKVMIGDIMLFIPGLAIINAVKDMFYGDIIAGLFGFIESIIVSLAIVAGFGLPSYLLGGVI